MSAKLRGLVILLIFCGTLAGVQAQAQTQPQEVRVVTRVLPPMVIDQKGQLGGFSIELWNKIAEKLELKTNYEAAPDVRGLLDAIRNGKAEAGISAVSITASREREFDFSQPMLNAGLQIMIRGTNQAGDSNPLSDLLGLLFSKAFLVWIGIAVLLILIPAHLMWFLERRHPNGILPTRDYYPGILHALYWAAATLATQAEQAPRQWLARVVTVLWMFTGVVFVALYTAQLAASLTVRQIQGGISGPDDLPGKRVATTRGSTAVAYLRDVNAQVVEVAAIDEAYTALLDKSVDAVVFDAPVLQYFAANAGKGRVQVVGSSWVRPNRQHPTHQSFRKAAALGRRFRFRRCAQANVGLTAVRSRLHTPLRDGYFAIAKK